MRLFIFTLILAAFLQTSFLQFQLVLAMLIARSFAVEEKQNYYLAFASGIFLGLLSTQNLGLWPLIFLLVVKLVHIIRKLPFTANVLIIIPVSFFLILITTYLESLLEGSSFRFTNVILATIISLPILIAVKFWEERFTIKPQIKLKI